MSTLNVRINQKYALYSEWMASELVLGRGEVAVCEIPSATAGTGLTPPAIGIKVGDGSKKFRELEWIQSTAGDVYAWAKKENLDFNDLTPAFVQEVKDLVHGEISDTNTTYLFSYENEKLIIKSKEKGSDELTDVAEFAITLSGKVDKVAGAVEGNLPAFNAEGGLVDSGKKIGDYATTAFVNDTFATKTELAEAVEATSEVAGKVTTLEGEMDAAEGRLDTAEGKITTLEGQVTALVGEDAGKSARTIANEELAKQLIPDNAAEALNELKEIAAWIQEHPGDASEMNAAIQQNADEIADLKEDSHVHTNKDVIDGITEDQVNAWDAAVQSISGVEATKTGTDVAVTAVPVTLLKNVSGDVLVFECGGAE